MGNNNKKAKKVNDDQNKNGNQGKGKRAKPGSNGTIPDKAKKGGRKRRKAIPSNGH